MERLRISVFYVVLYLVRHADNTTLTPGSSGMPDKGQSSNLMSLWSTKFKASTSTATHFFSVFGFTNYYNIETSTPALTVGTSNLLTPISLTRSIISVLPDRTNYSSSFIRFTVMTDKVLFTNSSSMYRFSSMTFSNSSGLQQRSSTVSADLSGSMESAYSSVLEGHTISIVSSYGHVDVSPTRDLSTYNILSSFTNTHISPVNETTEILKLSLQETLLYSKESVNSNFSREFFVPTSSSGFGITTLSPEIILKSSLVKTGVTSAFDSMSSSIPPTPADLRLGDLQRQISDLKEVENSYKIAVIVLAVIIVLLIGLIVFYVVKRRRYYKRKQLRLRGFDDDTVFNSNDKTKLRGHRPYFDPSASDQLGRSGRISTASFGMKQSDEEPINLLQSFTKNTKEPQQENDTDTDVEKEITKLKIDKVKDEEL